MLFYTLFVLLGKCEFQIKNINYNLYSTYKTSTVIIREVCTLKTITMTLV